jgi:hypothetical protein
VKTAIGRTFCGAVLGLGLLCARFAGAYTAPPTAPAWSANGSYSVSWSNQCGPDCAGQWLEERAGAGAFVSVGSVSPTTFSGKPAGQYGYRVGRLLVAFYDPYYFSVNYTVDYSAEVTVNVTAVQPTVDPLLTQRSYQYQARVGDIDYDGRKDLLVQRVAGGTAGNGVLDQLLVRQTSTPGQYALVPPTAAQAAVASAWPVSSARVAVEDINVDGFVDVVLKGVASALNVPGARDLIVYSPGQIGSSTPKGMRLVDDDLVRFVGNTLDYMVDRQFFETHVSWTYVYLEYYWSTCGGGPTISGDPFFVSDPGCIAVYQVTYGYYPDYSQFAGAAVSVASTADKVADGQLSASAGIDEIDRAAEGVFKIQIGGWGMEQVLGSTGEHTDPNVRRALEVFWAILGAARANAAEVPTVEAPPQVPRAFDVVYLTGHHLFGVGPLHTALEYTSAVRATTVISAGPKGAVPNLVSELNRVSDLAPLNMTLGTVSDPGNPLAASYFLELLATDAKYDDDLLYAAVPVLPGVYNSNSYVSGLLNATGGVPTIDMNAFVGGGKPVPVSEFQ